MVVSVRGYFPHEVWIKQLQINVCVRSLAPPPPLCGGDYFWEIPSVADAAGREGQSHRPLEGKEGGGGRGEDIKSLK